MMCRPRASATDMKKGLKVQQQQYESIEPLKLTPRLRSSYPPPLVKTNSQPLMLTRENDDAKITPELHVHGSQAKAAFRRRAHTLGESTLRRSVLTRPSSAIDNQLPRIPLEKQREADKRNLHLSENVPHCPVPRPPQTKCLVNRIKSSKTVTKRYKEKNDIVHTNYQGPQELLKSGNYTADKRASRTKGKSKSQLVLQFPYLKRLLAYKEPEFETATSNNNSSETGDNWVKENEKTVDELNHDSLEKIGTNEEAENELSQEFNDYITSWLADVESAINLAENDAALTSIVEIR